MIPGLTKPAWFEREIWPALVTGGGVIATAGLSLLKIFKETPPPDPACLLPNCTQSSQLHFSTLSIAQIAALAVTGVGAVFTVLRAHRRDAKLAQEKTPLDLAGFLHTLRQAALLRKGLDDDQRSLVLFRTTIHKVHEHEYEQVLEYIGGDPNCKGRAGRKFSNAKGVVGRVVRLGEPALFKRKEGISEADYTAELVRELGFTRPEVNALTRDRNAMIGVPVTAPDGAVIAVLYADSSDREFFSEEIQELMLGVAKGIASYVRVRYAK